MGAALNKIAHIYVWGPPVVDHIHFLPRARPGSGSRPSAAQGDGAESVGLTRMAGGTALLSDLILELVPIDCAEVHGVKINLGEAKDGASYHNCPKSGAERHDWEQFGPGDVLQTWAVAEAYPDKKDKKDKKESETKRLRRWTHNEAPKWKVKAGWPLCPTKKESNGPVLMVVNDPGDAVRPSSVKVPTDNIEELLQGCAIDPGSKEQLKQEIVKAAGDGLSFDTEQEVKNKWSAIIGDGQWAKFYSGLRTHTKI